MAWETALIVGIGIIPFFLQTVFWKMEEKLKDKHGFVGMVVFIINLFIFLLMIRVAVVIAGINDANIRFMLNGFYMSWLVFIISVILLFIFVYIPFRLFFQGEEGKGITTKNG